MEAILQDLRFSLRSLAKSPGFTAVAVFTLMLGVGANSAIFTLVNAVLLRPLPYPHSERLMTVWNHMTDLGQTRVSEPELLDFSRGLDSFEGLAAWDVTDANLSGAGRAERAPVARATASLFSVLGVRPAAGRLFLADDGKPGRGKVVVLGYELWRRRFGGADVIGQPIRINDESYVVVGVASRGFQFPAEAQLWMPMLIDPAHLSIRGQRNLQVIGRLKAGVSVDQARARAVVVAHQIAEEYHYEPQRHWYIDIVPLHEQQVARVRRSLLVLQGAVVLVLLMACANVASLMLARAQMRRGEVSLRLALGAGQGRLVRQFLFDGWALGIAGGTVGLLLAAAAVRLLLAANPDQLPSAAGVSLDGGILAFTLVISLVAGLLVSLAAAFTAMRTGLTESLADTGVRSSRARGSRRFHGALVVCEVTLAVVLLIGAGLLLKNFVRLERIDPGFDPKGLLTVRLTLPDAKYHEGSEASAIFYRSLKEKLAAIPLVQSVGMAEHLPFGRTGVSGPFYPAPGSTGSLNLKESPECNWNWVMPGYFETLRVPLLRGRTFDATDRAGAQRVVIIDAYLAHAVYGDADPVGRNLKLPGDDSNPYLQIVGVVGYVRQQGLDAETRGQIYLPQAQDPVVSMFVALRTQADPSALTEAVRNAVASLDKDLPIYDAMTMQERIATSLGQRRFATLLMGLFAGLALLLAGVGIYSVMAYSVSQRRQELGIRMALGAAPGRLRGMVVGEGMRLVLIGLVLGLGAALALGRLLQSLLYEASARDTAIFVAAPAVLALIALVANYLPARRASTSDPVKALRGTAGF